MNTPIKDGFKFDKDMKPQWITDKIDEDCINYLENLGFHLCNAQKNDDGTYRAGKDAMTTSQLRNFFGEIRRIQLLQDNSWRESFFLLKPKLAYAVAKVISNSRQKANRIKDFQTVVNIAHNQVGEDKMKFNRFCHFIEGIVAYHKVYGGKETSSNS